MPISLKLHPRSVVEITGEIPADVFLTHYKTALDAFRGEIDVNGFRRGKAPDAVVLKQVGDGTVLERAAQIALNHEYPKILSEQKIRSIGSPSITITKLAKGNPLGFTIKTAVLPEIAIDGYREAAAQAIKNYTDDLVVNDDDVQKTLDFIKKTRVEQKTDAGPEITPELVKQSITEEKKRKNKEKKRVTILEALAKHIKTDDIPEVLINSEKHKMFHETKHYVAGMGIEWSDYLKNIKKEEKELLSGMEEDAIKRVKFALVLDYVSEKEKIEAPERDVDDEVKQVMEQAKSVGDTQLDEGDVKRYTEGIIRNEHVLRFLETLAPSP